MIELDITDANAKNILAKQLADKIEGAVVICIGTDRVVADSLGPRVGSLLNENLDKPLFVYGLQGANITAQNLQFAIGWIKRMHPNNRFLIVDAAVGEQSQVGKVQFVAGDIAPGAATNKQLGRVGDVSIVGIVDNKSMKDFYNNSVEMSILVERLSQFIAMAITKATKCNNV